MFEGWRVKVKERLFIFCIFMFSMFGISCSVVDERTPRTFVSAIAAATYEMRQGMNAEILKGDFKEKFMRGPISLAAPWDKEAAPDFLVLTEQGNIIAYKNEFSTLVVLSWSINEGKVSWICTVYPSSAKVSVCR